ncbi:type II secretion system F family protein [Ramlibacter sp. MAHUQ-53]|uniref:type II secretion system F family protein n=1 Tax=unclassified Ramlibacter TaxID=2617605 RepID=UPI0036286142
MDATNLSQSQWLLGLMVFIALMLGVEGLYLLWRNHHGPEARRLRRRLEAIASPGEESGGGAIKPRLARELPWMRAWLERMPRLRALDRLLVQSGLPWSLGRVALAMTGLALAGAVLGQLAAGLHALAPVAAVAAAPAALAGYIAVVRARRLQRLERQLPDALDLLTRALRAGHAFGSALKITADEAVEPMGAELAQVHEETNYGVPLEQALEHLCERVPLTSVRYFTVAVLIQRTAGGNLTEILGGLSRLLRQRVKLLDRIHVLSAEGRLSAWILVVLPFALAGLLYLINPQFMSPLWQDPIGRSMIQVLLLMMAVGGVVMRRIIKIRV